MPIFPFTFSLTVAGISNPFSTQAQSEPVPPIIHVQQHQNGRLGPRRRPSPAAPLLTPSSSTSSLPLSRKRGWEPSLPEPSHAATFTTSTSGYLDTPAKYRDMASGRHHEPAGFDYDRIGDRGDFEGEFHFACQGTISPLCPITSHCHWYINVLASCTIYIPHVSSSCMLHSQHFIYGTISPISLSFFITLAIYPQTHSFAFEFSRSPFLPFFSSLVPQPHYYLSISYLYNLLPIYRITNLPPTSPTMPFCLNLNFDLLSLIQSAHSRSSLHTDTDTDADAPPPSKRRRTLAGSIASTALSAALIGTAVGITVYRL
jgi:hypothetical protein